MGINISNLVIPLDVLLPEGHELILLHAKDSFEYKNGKKTDVRLGTSYEVIENGGEFQKFSVKIIDNESAIEEKEIAASSEKIHVEFSNALCRLYVDDSRRIQVSVKADAINVL